MSRNRNSRARAVGILHFDATARIPAHVQLEEQVKVALALGKLRPGDVLPSIRQVEDELGVGRMLVRKAYQQLQHAGLVRIIHGRGAVVTGQARANGRLTSKAEALVQRTVAEVRREGLDPVTFARLLHQRLVAEDARQPRILCVASSDALARELGQQIQQALGVRVQTAGLPRLRRSKSAITRDTQVLVDYYYLADVRKVIGRKAGGVYPVSWDYDAAFLDRLRDLPLGSRILLLYFESSLKEQGTLLAIDALVERLKDREFDIHVKAVEAVPALGRLKTQYRAVIVSNRVWDEHAALLEREPDTFVRLSSRVNHQSLEAVRDRLGIVL